jgi:molecular chaperone DnaK
MAGRYWLGVDVGTTFTAAAIRRDGRTEVVQLATRGAAIPSVLLLRADGELLTGDTAKRRAVSEPDRVASEFKRRVGDPVPVLVGGSPFAAETLVARLLKWVVDQVSQREGGPPEGIAVTHPANWGPYKLDLLANAIRTAGLGRVTFLSEPAAAARHYATLARVPDGATVAVYDLGGGTFDACVLRKEPDGSFTLLGQPEGIERLGGIDLDQAVFGHVQRSAPDLFEGLDPDDPSTRAALAHLRDECTDAKEQLSGDVDASIAVLLAGQAGRDVRITRSEFEDLIRPVLADTIGCVQRSLANAGVTAAELHAVLLVGGSSRVPLVGQLVATGLGRPVAVDADPKLVVAQGAALAAEAELSPALTEAPAQETTIVPEIAPVVTAPVLPVAPAEPAVVPQWTAPAPEPARTVVQGGRSKLPVIAAVVLLLAAAVGGFLLFGPDDDPGDDVASDATTTTEAAAESTTTSSTEPALVGGAEFAGVDPTLPQFIDITTAAVDDGLIKLFFESNFVVDDSAVDGPENHIHFFYGNGNRDRAGNSQPNSCTCWLAFGGASPVESQSFSLDNLADNTEICAVVATPEHDIADVDDDGEVDPGSGDCIDVSEIATGATEVSETAAGPPAPVVALDEVAAFASNPVAHPTAACLL